MIIPRFKSEAEEADWLYANRKRIEAVLTAEKPRKSLNVEQIVERERTKAISLRLSVTDLERAKRHAKAKGIGYQTLIRMLLHESLAAL